MIINRVIPIKFEIDNTTTTYSWWTHYNVWETYVFTVMDRYLTRKQNFIDVGAWNGAVSLYASNLCKNVYAFEPDPVAYEDLIKNKGINEYTNIHAFEVAISDKNSTSYIYTTNTFGNSCSTLKERDTEKIEVQTNTFENVIDLYDISNVGLIKMDIEGWEDVVLPNMLDYLSINKTPIHLSLHWHLFDVQKMIGVLMELSKIYTIENAWSQITTVESIINEKHGELLLF